MAADSLLVNKIAKNVKHICTLCNNFYNSVTYLDAHIKAKHEKIGSVYLYSCANNSVVICTGTLPRSIHALISSSIICLHFTAYCTVACWGDELTYVADADAMLTGEGKGETNTNSLVVQ